MDKIQMKTPLVEMDGDEMTRVLWQMIKDTLILPYVELRTEYYDLGLLNRNDTDDQVTVDAANAAKRWACRQVRHHHTPNEQRMEEYPQLKKMWKSPNGTIRAIMDGTVFPHHPIPHRLREARRQDLAGAHHHRRHAYGDVYRAARSCAPASPASAP